MPLIATHVKFALDIKDKYQAQELGEYLSGTVYPDSRFITGIDRHLTHISTDKIQSENLSDFEKGWVVHCICDRVHNKLFNKIAPKFFGDLGLNQKQGTNWRMALTGFKNILEMFVYKSFDLQQYLSSLKINKNPNEEDREKIDEYNDLIIKVYKDRKEFGIKEVEELWSGLEVDKELIEKIMSKTEEFLEDEKLLKEIEKFYGLMLDNFD